MKIICGILLLCAVSTHYAMERDLESVKRDDSSDSSALEGAFAQIITDHLIQKSEASSSRSATTASAQESLKPCPHCPPALLTSLKVLAAGVVGAGLGEGAYRLGLIKNERIGLVTGASIGMGAFGGAGKLQEGLVFVQKYLPNNSSNETLVKEIEMKEVSQE